MFGLQSELLIAAMFIAGLSGVILHYCLKFNVTAGSRLTPLAGALSGILLSIFLPDFGNSVLFFAVATAQFIAFVFVSRLRQRGSFFWHALASLASNGTWYITLHLFDGAGANWIYILPFIAGVVSGRTIGVLWAQYVEKKFDLKADATRDDRLAPGKRMLFIAMEPTFWVLIYALIGYLAYGITEFEAPMRDSLLIIIGLSILQSLFYAMNTRAVQRGNDTYIALTSVVSSVMFYVNAVYLLSQDMPFALFIPYMLATTLGSTLGAFFSMIIEWKAGIAPDTHLGDKKTAPAVKPSKVPYIIMAVLALYWILASDIAMDILGIPINPIKFPLPLPGFNEMPRPLIMLAAALIFFLDTALHTVTSRAGNRNHAGYHVSACIPKGVVDFSKMGYLALNSRIPEIVPIAVFVGCLGSLFGKTVSESIEVWLEARMDIPAEKKPAAPAAAILQKK